MECFIKKSIIYKEIPGFPNYYAGSDGNVYSRNYKKKHIPEEYRKMKPSTTGNGYLGITLKVDNMRITQRVHVLICIAFHGARPRKMEASHLNDKKTDNRPENLLWETEKANKARRYVNGKSDSGFHNSRACLTENQFREVKRMLSEGKTHQEIADIYFCSRTVITRINTGSRYARCKGDF